MTTLESIDVLPDPVGVFVHAAVERHADGHFVTRVRARRNPLEPVDVDITAHHGAVQEAVDYMRTTLENI